ncbi:PepSY domain-containing protein [Frateuria aurantia]
MLFQIHWLLGITAGLVLAVMGVTGAMMSFQDELIAAFNPRVIKVTAVDAARLPPSALMAAAVSQHGAGKVNALVLEGAPDRADQIEFAPTDPAQHHGARSYINPYTGVLLGSPRGADFFMTVRNLHRYMLLPGDAGGIGRPITGIATLSLIFFALSGLYLRWPRKPLEWRNWFTIDLRRRGRDLYRQLHAVIGVWLMLFYLVSGLTGLWWSFGTYRTGVSHLLSSTPVTAMAGREHGGERGAGRGGARGHGRHGGRAGDGADPAADVSFDPVILDRIWQQFIDEAGPGMLRASIMLPREPRDPVVIRRLDQHARYARMTDDWNYASNDGHFLSTQRYRDLATGDMILGHILPIHDGSFFGLPGRVALLLSSLTMPLFTVTGLLLYLGRRRQKQRLRAIALPAPAAGSEAAGPWIIYASQAGHAERLARLTAQAFVELGQQPRLIVLDHWQPWQCKDGQLCLFVVSTYGEGEPPDQGRFFAKSHLQAEPGRPLPALEFAVLALGDRLYPDFCAFGRRLDAWLEQSGARRGFPMLALDGEQPEGLRRWQRQLRRWGVGGFDSAAWDEQPWQSWRLVGRECLNPGSAEHPAYSLRLAAPEGVAAGWLAGDLVEILPSDAAARMQIWLDQLSVPVTGEVAAALVDEPAVNGVSTSEEVRLEARDVPALKPREYSIASIDSQREIHLLIRQVRHEDGRLGICSGWLTSGLAVGDEVPLRIRSNPGFHPPPDEMPLILIGSGTGLAGLLAHLRARAAAGIGNNWLLFGERHDGQDAFFGDELEKLLKDGRLQRLDRVYSRDGHGPRYVQDRLVIAGTELLEWVEQGAAIYVCGSLQGMAADVDLCLREILGAARLDAMSLTGRYRRDVY